MFRQRFSRLFRAEQQSPARHDDKTSNARQVQNRRQFHQPEMQLVSADRRLELAVDYLSPNGRDAGYTSPLQFEELGPYADC